MAGGGSTYLPLRVNMAGVIPVIFAASLMAFPPTIGELISSRGRRTSRPSSAPNGAAYIVGESILIILFTYFYTAVTFNPVEQADNLKKYGGFIPGVRPGRPTAEYLDRILARLTFPGALYLAAVAALPTILINQTARELLLRRHLDPDRGRRRARHDEAARGAADDAQLRGLPEVDRARWPPAVSPDVWTDATRSSVAPPVSELNLILLGPPGRRQGHPGRAPRRRLRPALLRDRRHPARGRQGGYRARQGGQGLHGQGRPRPGRADLPRDHGADRLAPRPPTASCSTASRARSARPRCSRTRSTSAAAR